MSYFIDTATMTFALANPKLRTSRSASEIQESRRNHKPLFRMDEKIIRGRLKGLTTYRNACMGYGIVRKHEGVKMINLKDCREKELKCVIGDDVTVLAQKVYNNTEVNCIFESLQRSVSDYSYLEAPGKHVEVIGIDNYNETSYHRVFLALKKLFNDEELMKRNNLCPGLERKTFIIQGLGKLGTSLAKLLILNGAICVGFKDEDVFTYNPQGIDLHKLNDFNYKLSNLTIPDNSNFIYKKNCDFMILAVNQKNLNCCLYKDIKVKVLIEVECNSISPSTRNFLKEKSQLVVPYINNFYGSTVVAYVEYLWNIQQLGTVNNQVLRFLNILKQLQTKTEEKEEEVITQPISSLSASVDPSIINRSAILDTIEIVLANTQANTEKKLFDYTDFLNLDRDVRIATFIIGISNIFKALYQHKRFF